MDTFLKAIDDFLASALVAEPPPPDVLNGLQNKLADLGQISIEWGQDGISDWLNRFKSLFGDEEIRDSLLVRVLQLRYPRIAEALTIAGIFTFDFTNTGIRTFHIDSARFEGFLKHPGQTAADTNYWFSKIQSLSDVKLTQSYLMMLAEAPIELINLEYKKKGFAALPAPPAPDITLDDLIGLVNSPLRAPLPVTPPLDLQAFKDSINNALTNDYLAFIGPDALDPAHPLNGFGIELKVKEPQKAFAAKSLDLGNGWMLRFTSKAEANGEYRITMKGEEINLDPANGSNADAEILISRGANKKMLIGPATGPHVEIGNVSAGLSAKSSINAPGKPRFGVTVSLDQVALVLKTDILGPLAKALPIPSELKFSTDFKLPYLQGIGFGAPNGALPPLGIEYTIPLNLTLGTTSAGLKIDAARVRLEVSFDDPRTVKLSMRFSASGQLGPLRLIVEDAGAWIGKVGASWGDAEPPTGIGLSLDAGPISGGGFLQKLSDLEYGGALQLKILGIGAFAYGIFGSLPSGEATFVALIGIRFPPPGIQLGFGFSISGLGGLIGINRRADTDLLRERLASGSAGNVLFNDNPISNAPMLLNELGRFFPGEAGVFIVGPTLQIDWLELLKLDVGVFIELPGPRKIFVAGSAKMIIGASEELALVYLRLDFIGGIDFTKKLIFFDASLINSHVIHIFKLTGDTALRIAYGPNGYFLFSAGGFHPSFNPGPLEIPKLARVGSSMSLDVAIANIWIKQQMYVAITSNTFQLGARTEAGIEIGPLSAHGWFGFDALVQFDPFHFVATIEAGFDVEFEGISLCGVSISGEFSGPGPLMISARASIKILFVRVSAHVSISLGGDPSSQPVPISDVLGRISGEITLPANLRAEGIDSGVIFKSTDPLSLPLVSPVGQLIWEQRRVPLGLDIERLEGAPLDGIHHITVTPNLPKFDKETDWFGVGTYHSLTDSEALNNARMSEELSGVRVGTGDHRRGLDKTCNVSIDLVLLPERARIIDLTVLSYLSKDFMQIQVEANVTPMVESGDPLVKLVPHVWTVADRRTGVLNPSATSPIQAFLTAKEGGGIAVAVAANPVELTGVFG